MNTKSTLGALAATLALTIRITASAATPDFWIPYAASPVSGTSGGKSGLFVVASNKVGGSSAPAPQWITESTPTLLGAAFSGFLGGSTAPASATPATLIYAARGSDGSQHLYGLDLANPSASATAPKPAQITNLSIPSSNSVCAVGQIETDGSKPTTLEVIVYVATPEAGTQPGMLGYCAGVPGGTYYLAAYGKSSSTAPVVVDIPGGTSTLSAITNDGNFTPLYLASGDLGGLIYWNSVTQDENLYTDANFTGASTLLKDVPGTPTACVNGPAVAGGAFDYLGGSALVTVNTSSGFKSYQLQAAGKVVEFFAGLTTGCITDPDNLYFVGTRNGATVSTIYQESLSDLAVPKTLLTGLSSSSSKGYSLIGANGANVIFQEYTVSGTGAVSTTIDRVPVGVTSSKPSALGGPFSGTLVTGVLAPADGGAITGLDWLLVTTLTETGGATPSLTYASAILDPNGSGTVMSVPANTVLQSFGPFSTEVSGTVLEISGITDTDGGFGGASVALLAVGVSSPAKKLTLNGGAGYKVSAGYEVSASGFRGSSVATGGLFSLDGAPSMGLAIDTVKDTIVPLGFAHTNVMPLL
jgi:hypothetical protein